MFNQYTGIMRPTCDSPGHRGTVVYIRRHIHYNENTCLGDSTWHLIAFMHFM